jgi:hypothetical protein
MTDLRAERRAYAVQIWNTPVHGTQGLTLQQSYDWADAFIQHDLDNPPEWEFHDRIHRDVGQSRAAKTVKASPSGWVRATDRLPTQADAPEGYLHVADGDGDSDVYAFEDYVKYESVRTSYPYWHPAVGQFQIPDPPK